MQPSRAISKQAAPRPAAATRHLVAARSANSASRAQLRDTRRQAQWPCVVPRGSWHAWRSAHAPRARTPDVIHPRARVCASQLRSD
eukprot:6188550-Pleurochrysis_carterae.AAC.2